MNLLRAFGIGVATYLGMVVAVVVFPALFLVALWVGVCGLAAIFLFVFWLFVFWLFVTHNPYTLYSSLYMLAYGAPPCIGASVLSFYFGQLRARQRAPVMTVRQDAPFHCVGRCFRPNRDITRQTGNVWYWPNADFPVSDKKVKSGHEQGNLALKAMSIRADDLSPRWDHANTY